ncbi:MAG TPA: 50S ribosomal protein L5 [Candidatus Marinimicrobia bacterium]|nr:50S ribosomal protein L5 [Candidatus Neomarinimicrobiota bacterium]
MKKSSKISSGEKIKSVPTHVNDTKSSSSKKGKKGIYSPNLKNFYLEKIVNKMISQFNYSNTMQVPKLEKITLNMGIGDTQTNSKALDSAVEELTLIAGQKSVVTRAKKDVSNFKIRKGNPVGAMVTLRSNRMYEFFERLNAIALPRTRDFRGFSFKSFDGRGNYNFGINEQIIFTEIDYDKIDAIHGLDVAISTTAITDEEAYLLLKELGFPLREKPVKKEVVE